MKRTIFYITLLTVMISIAFAALADPLPASADDGKIIVNTDDDKEDGSCDDVHCSLREAIGQSNDTQGRQTIVFEMPDPGNYYTIQLCSPLPDIADPVTIDGTLPPGTFGPPSVVIKPWDINNLPPWPCNPPPYGFWVGADDVILRGMSMVGFLNFQAETSGAIIVDNASNALIEYNQLGVYPNGVVEGNYNAIYLTDENHIVRNNLISGNWYGINSFASDTTIQGNYIGTDISGTSTSLLLGNQTGIFLWCPSESTTIGGVNPDEMNLISGNSIGISICSDSTIYGNRIGTDRTGTMDLGNSNGIMIGGDDNIIGGPLPGQGNLISGNGLALSFASGADDNIIQGNNIGADISGNQALVNAAGNWHGMIVFGDSNTIGGTNPGEGNRIAFITGEGIDFDHGATSNHVVGNTIFSNVTGVLVESDQWYTALMNTLSQNSIYDNMGLGIDLEPAGVSLNDVGDTDSGGNTVLNFPVFSAGFNSVSGTACPGCIVELYISDNDSSGYGEGSTFISQTVAEDDGDFTIPVMLAYSHCTRLTATATDIQGNTSEFSRNVEFGLCISHHPWNLFIPMLSLGLSLLAGVLFGRSPKINGRAALAVAGIVGLGLAGGLFLILRSPTKAPAAQPAEMDPWAGLPSCSDYIEPDSLSPDEEVFALEDDPVLSWSPLEDMLPDPVRWTVELSRHPDPAQSETTSEEHLAFSAFGLQPDPGDIYKWRLSGEMDGSADGSWRFFCAPTDWLPFQFERLIVPAAPSDTPEPSPTPTQTPTPAPDVCVYTAIRNANCRSSDHSESEQINILMQGESAALLALNPEFTHGQFELDQESCWIWLGLLDGPENPFGTCNVPIIDPAPACTPELDEQACILAGGQMSETRTTAPFCVCPD
jgi:CSLREA domain-containing protein